MEVLSSHDGGSRRALPSAPVGVAVALLLLAPAQGYVALQPQPLPAGASVEALPNGYSFGSDGDRATLGFQLRNSGDRSLQVVGIGADVPGLQSVDVIASGAPFRFQEAGAGTQPLPSFRLPAGTVIEVNLVYRVRRCGDVPRDQRTVAVAVTAGRAQGVLQLPLPGQPAEAVGSGPDDEDPWQQVLVRDVCG